MDVDGHRWDLLPGESEEELWERAKAEVQYTPHGVASAMRTSPGGCGCQNDPPDDCLLHPTGT